MSRRSEDEKKAPVFDIAYLRATGTSPVVTDCGAKRHLEPQPANLALDTMMTETDVAKTRVTLLRKLRDQGDHHAWTEFVQFYRRFIYNIIRRMDVNHHDAEEITQIILLKSWKTLPNFDYDPGRGRFRGWLCRVTGNEVKRFHRNKKPVDHAVSLDADEGQTLTNFGNEPEIEKIAESEWNAYLPQLAWKNVKSKFHKNARETYRLLGEGRSTKAIAKTLNIAESTVYVHKKRVLDTLRKEVARLNDEL